MAGLPSHQKTHLFLDGYNLRSSPFHFFLKLKPVLFFFFKIFSCPFCFYHYLYTLFQKYYPFLNVWSSLEQLGCLSVLIVCSGTSFLRSLVRVRVRIRARVNARVCAWQPEVQTPLQRVKPQTSSGVKWNLSFEHPLNNILTSFWSHIENGVCLLIIIL